MNSFPASLQISVWNWRSRVMYFLKLCSVGLAEETEWFVGQDSRYADGVVA